MEWLSEWIKQIILLVLIATFIDLLLPNQSFDRYVKLVLGLLIIMAILTPILQLINQDFDLTKWNLWKTDQTAAAIDSLSTIQAKSKQFQAYQDAQIQEEWEKKVAELLKEQLRQQFSLKHVDVKAKGRVQEGKEPQLLSVRVRAETSSNSENEQVKSAIPPVEDIRVELRETSEPKAKDPAFAKRITKYIQQTWKIDAEQIDVIVETDT